MWVCCERSLASPNLAQWLAVCWLFIVLQQELCGCAAQRTLTCNPHSSHLLAVCCMSFVQAGNKSYVGALAYAPPGFLPNLENGAVISGGVLV